MKLTSFTYHDLDTLQTQIVAVYRATFTAPPWDETEEDVTRFSDRLGRHAQYAGFRGWYAGEANEMLGFVYGYTNAPEQAYRQAIARVGRRACRAMAGRVFRVCGYHTCIMLDSRVLLLIYNPIIEVEGGRRLNQVLGWNDPDDLASRYIADVHEASHGFVHYRITERIELDSYPLKADGFRYTDDTYLRCWRARQDFHHPDTADYPALLRDAAVVPKVEAGHVDELWAFGFPYAGFYESCMAGRGAIWCNGPVIPGTERISRRFVVMGFNYERGVGEMLEDLGHRAESIMEYVFRDVPDAPVSKVSEVSDGVEAAWWDRLFGAIGLRESKINNPQSKIDLSGNLWKQFIRYDKSHPGMASCGNVHFAPSSMTDYDWGNRRPVHSNADDWLNYPNFTGQTRTMTCADWGHGDIRQHHIWWMKRFPHVEGTTPTGKLNNWWDYVIQLKW